ncbi:MAG TPA: cohesin domain-containing protein [Candidatus Acidoferrum sp.]|nr:cohesin domain-containing protein [Candidatus Acidoferrum sp.]
MQQKRGTLILCVTCVCFGLIAAGCPKGGGEYTHGLKAENLQDYDAAVAYYEKAVKEDPQNATYKIRLHQARFDACEYHLKRGLEMRKRGELDGAAVEFQKAFVADPSSSIAEQELKRTADMIEERAHPNQPEGPTDHNQQPLASMPPELKPLNRGALSMKMSNDAKIVFDTIGKWAGVTMIYDPDFPARKINFEVNNVTLEQALEIASLESKAAFKPVTENTLFVYPDQPQKRRENEEEVVKTFYLSNVSQPQDITEIMTGLRQLFDLKRIQQVNAQNAIIIRDTPDRLMLVQKMLDDIDKEKPEVVVQVEVLQVSKDRLRELGIQPGSQATVAVTGSTTSSSSSGSSGSTPATNPITFDTFRHLNPGSFSVTLPSLTLNLVESDSDTKIIQNPEIRSVDGQTAKLKIGQRIPIATGSFQAGVGVGGTAGTGFVNPLVNTQFTYLDVGVNVDVTPRVHPNHEVTLKLRIEISSELTTTNIGGISQPVIGSKTIEHDIRLKEGETNILGGLIERTDTKTISGWPGLARIPILGRFFSDNKVEHQEDETLIVLTPHIVRMPFLTKGNLQPMLSGPDQNPQTRRESELRAPQPETQQPSSPATQPQQPQQQPPVTTPTTPNAGLPSSPAPQAQSGVAKIRFEPQTLTLKAGQTATLGVVVENVNDLYSIPMLLQYDPKVISVEEVQHGGFLSGGGSQVIAIPWQVLKDKGQAIISATRPPSTPGVSGSGTLIGIVVKALAPGSTNLSIVQVNAKDSQQKAVQLVTSEAALQVQP